MKRCPTCNRTYPDEQAFCMDDGATLVDSPAASDPAATAAFTGQTSSMPPSGTQGFGSNAAPGYQPPPPPGMFPPPMGGPAADVGTASKLQPAVIGGLVTGVLSAGTFLIPVPLANWCCCLWGVLGGALAVYLYVKRSSVPVKTGDGAILGLLAGGIGALVYMLIVFPAAYFVIDAEALQAQIEQRMRRQGQTFDIRPYWGLFLFLVIFVFGVILTVLSLIGGLIGVPIFEKRQGGVAPPPPQNYQ